jgi:hypothetical protein
VYYNCVNFHKNSISSLVGVALTRYMPPLFMKLYTVVLHNLQMCMKEYRCCLKFRRGDNSTYTFTPNFVCRGYNKCERIIIHLSRVFNWLIIIVFSKEVNAVDMI